MIETRDNEMVVRLRFDRPLTDRQATELVGVMAEEMEFRDPLGGRYRSPGWGIGKARILEVAQLLPGDLLGVEDGEMLALRLEEAGRPRLATKARSGASRAKLLEEILEPADPDPELVAIVVGRPGSP